MRFELKTIRHDDTSSCEDIAEMKLLDRFFRRQPPIRDKAALADFVDAQSAFLVQKGIYEYSRARAGHYAKVLFAEEGFAKSVELSRWQAYPLGLAMVGEMVEGVLRQHAGDRRAMLDELTAVVLSVFDRYPVPPSIGEDAWLVARGDLARRIEFTAGHAPKRVMDIPEPLAETYFALMPIHEKLRGRDFATTRNYLRVSLCNIHDELIERMDSEALKRAFTAGATVGPRS
jgi:hypothetical protein